VKRPRERIQKGGKEEKFTRERVTNRWRFSRRLERKPGELRSSGNGKNKKRDLLREEESH